MNATLFGDFSCATRRGYLPLWVVNGVSADAILETAGYNGTYSEHIPLLVAGHVLSFLSIPASPATNNSVVSCAAVSNGSQAVVTYSKPVRLTVLQGMVRDS